MADSPHPAGLIDVAARPLADNAELHLAAADFLTKLEVPAQGATEAVARWNALDACPRRPVRRYALWAALVIASAAVWLAQSGDLVRYFEWGKWLLHPFSGTPKGIEERVSRGLDAKQKLLLFGDTTKEFKDERMEALWRSDPENPAYFAEYAAAYLGEHDKLPPDFLETARRIDPQNAWFTCLAAAVEGKESVREKRGKAGEPARTWEILDQARFDRSLALFQEARLQPECEHYTAEMLAKRLCVLGDDTLSEATDALGVLANQTVFGMVRLMPLGEVIAAKAWLLGEAGDAEGFREFSNDVDDCLRKFLGTKPGVMLDEVVCIGMVARMARGFSAASEKPGLADDAARWQAISERLRQRNEARKSAGLVVDGRKVEPREVRSVFCGDVSAVANWAERQPPLTDADLKPWRMIDHEILSRFCGYLVWLLTGLCLGLVALHRFRVPVLLRRLAGRVGDLMRPVDWLWILGLGVALPFVFVMVVNRFTPLGGRDFGVRGVWLLLPAGHFLGLLVLWLLVPAAVVRWRLARRTAFLGFSSPSWASLLSITCALAFVPVIGWAAISGPPGGFWSTWMEELGLDAGKSGALSQRFCLALGLLAVPALWLAVTVFRALMGAAHSSFFRAAQSVILVRALAAAMLLIMLSTLVFKSAEQAWFEKDTLLRTDANTPGWTRYEYLVAVQMRKELREILGIP